MAKLLVRTRKIPNVRIKFQSNRDKLSRKQRHKEKPTKRQTFEQAHRYIDKETHWEQIEWQKEKQICYKYVNKNSYFVKFPIRCFILSQSQNVKCLRETDLPMDGHSRNRNSAAV